MFPGAKYAIGPAIQRRALLATASLPTAQHLSDDDLERTRPACARSSRPTKRSLREELDREQAIATFAETAPTRSRSSSAVDSRGLAEIGEGKVSPSTATRTHPLPRAAGPSSRTLPWPTFRPPSASARSSHPRSRGERNGAAREAPDAPAHLRHRVGSRGGARGAPPPIEEARSAITARSGPS